MVRQVRLWKPPCCTVQYSTVCSAPAALHSIWLCGGRGRSWRESAAGSLGIARPDAHHTHHPHPHPPIMIQSAPVSFSVSRRLSSLQAFWGGGGGGGGAQVAELREEDDMILWRCISGWIQPSTLSYAGNQANKSLGMSPITLLYSHTVDRGEGIWSF